LLRAIFLVSPKLALIPELRALLFLLVQIPVVQARRRQRVGKRKQENKARNLREQFGMDSSLEPRTHNAKKSEVHGSRRRFPSFPWKDTTKEMGNNPQRSLEISNHLFDHYFVVWNAGR